MDVDVKDIDPNDPNQFAKMMATFIKDQQDAKEKKSNKDAEFKVKEDKHKEDLAEAFKTIEALKKSAVESKIIQATVTKETNFFNPGYEVKDIFTTAGMKRKSFEQMLEDPTENKYVKEIQSRSDDLYLLGVLIGTKTNQPIDRVIPQLKSYEYFMEDTKNLREAMWNDAVKENYKAMSIGSGEAGNDWIPTGFSSSLIEIFHLQMVLMNIHPNFNIPRKMTSWKVPGASSDLKAYLTEAAASDNPTKFKASTRSTRNITFTPVKFTAAALFDVELEEDSIIPILPNLKVNIVEAQVRAIENTIINGDTAGIMDNTDMHGDVINSQSPTKGWDGWRKFITNHGSVRTNAGGSASFDAMIAVKRNMGKYGIRNTNLKWVTGPNGLYDGFVRLAKLHTIDLFGAAAIVNNSDVMRFMGIPVIVTEEERQDLKATTGVSGGASSAYNDTSIQLVWGGGFAFGKKRNITVQSAQIPRTDTVEIWSTVRADFQANYTTAEPIIAEVTNIA